MVSLVSIAASHAGEVSRVLKTTISTPLNQLGEVYHTVLLKVAHAHPHGMVNQGKLVAGHANEATRAQNHTILRGWYQASRMDNGRNNRRRYCHRSSMT